MTKITMIGAGSINSPRRFIGDILSFPELEGATISLMDVDPDRLDTITRIAEILLEDADSDATIESTLDRREALDGADYVISTIHVGGREPFENEIRIPERYGVKQAIGDTLGPGGIFRGLRTAPVLVDIAEDMEELCPGAPLINYSNPMAINCWAVDEATDVDVYGICHSVQGTIGRIADYVGITDDRSEALSELDYWVAGINHMAWVLECTWDGEDVYPMLREAMTDPDVYERDTVRFEILRHFGAFVTESSHHMSEYVPYFRTDQEVIDEMAGRDMAGRIPTATYLEGWIEGAEAQEEQEFEDRFDPASLTVERSHEYPIRIVHSIETGEVRRMNINVRNRTGAIANLPREACVEVPCVVDGTGIRPCSVGDLPSQLAALNRSNVHVQEHAVRAALEADREALYHAMKLDPLTAAALSLDEIHEMTDELIEANAEYIPSFD